MSRMGFGTEPPAAREADNGHLYVTVKACIGTDIVDACREAIVAARRLGLGVRFTFNDITVMAWPASDTDALVADWRKAFGAPASESR